MRHVNIQLKADRRCAILKAAERCFARSGFHQTSMQEICSEAAMSAGNVYRYFRSKEAIIEGIAEQNGAEAAESFAMVNRAASFFDGLKELARHHLVERSEEEIALCAEILTESRRNPEVARVRANLDTEITEAIVAMLQAGQKRGEIRADIDLKAVATLLMVLGDGMSWRRAAMPGFDTEAVLPLILEMVHGLLVPRKSGGPADAEKNR